MNTVRRLWSRWQCLRHGHHPDIRIHPPGNTLRCTRCGKGLR